MIYSIVDSAGVVIANGECPYESFPYVEAPNGCTVEIGNIVSVAGEPVESEYMINRKLKYLKNDDVSKIIVTTASGKEFDGDEKSQDRMMRAIQIASITGVTQTQWKLADNTTVMVTLDEMKEALSLAGNAMSQIWLR